MGRGENFQTVRAVTVRRASTKQIIAFASAERQTFNYPPATNIYSKLCTLCRREDATWQQSGVLLLVISIIFSKPTAGWASPSPLWLLSKQITLSVNHNCMHISHQLCCSLAKKTPRKLKTKLCVGKVKWNILHWFFLFERTHICILWTSNCETWQHHSPISINEWPDRST